MKKPGSRSAEPGTLCTIQTNQYVSTKSSKYFCS